MPELPEVETIKLGLHRTILNQKITKIDILLPKMFSGDPTVVTNATISDIKRRGKMLIIDVTKDSYLYHLLIHLKMTGQLIFESQTKPGFGGGHPVPPLNTPLPNKSTKIIMEFESEDKLYFNDLRTFGYIKLVPARQLHENTFLQQIGIEPLTPEFTLETFAKLLEKRPKANIKAFLLDQTHIAGLGNIYTDESVFRAGILPWRIVSSLSEQEILLLHGSIKDVLQAGIELQGASQTSYIGVDGKKGTFLAQAAVYGRANLPCLNCGQPIQKTKWAGRGTHYCSNCQK